MLKKQNKFITFKLHDQLWAMPLTGASQFFSCDYILPVPKLGEKFAGITYHNGQLVTVLRVDKLLGIKPILSQQALLFTGHDEYYALIVSAGQDILSASEVFNDRSKKVFSHYIKNKSAKIYILEPEELFSIYKIYD